HELCDDKGPTLFIAKIKDTGRLIGGYNAMSDNNNFLFSFANQEDLNSRIIARYATNLNGSSFSSINDPGSINLFDLTIKDDIIECNSTHSFPGIKSFISVGQKFSMEDYEVFKITKLK